MTIQLGTLPGSLPLEEAQSALRQVGELAELTQVSADPEWRYCLFVCHASQAQPALDALKDLGWSRANLREWTGTAHGKRQAYCRGAGRPGPGSGRRSERSWRGWAKRAPRYSRCPTWPR